ncbi:hypothetical protein [uncultured Prevotella sp.]|uniref:hypothetical protein n=1 Tax=uncultured Prevotella sp. TaxID=159272 RepID=UPI00266D5E9A|nr:hypothetical protein [uncultured Prevotella sp.]
MFTFYTTEDKLTELCLEGGTWYDIIRNQRTIYVCNDSDEEEWDISNEILLNLYRGGVEIEVDNEVAEDIKKDTKNVLELVNPAYILDYSEQEATEISRKYGVIFLPTQNTPEPAIAETGWTLDTSDDSKEQSWDFFLSGIKTKYNSLVIIDRYFFSSEYGESLEDSKFNLRSILNILLPKEQMHKFTVSIIFDITKADKEMQELATEVNKIKKTLVGHTSFDMELISIDSNCYNYDKTHDRFIVSNYFVIDAAHKIKAFRTDKTVLTEQNIHFKYLYSEGIRENDKSSKPEVSQDRILKAVCDAMHTSKREMLHAANGQMSQKGDFQPKNEMFCL